MFRTDTFHQIDARCRHRIVSLGTLAFAATLFVTTATAKPGAAQNTPRLGGDFETLWSTQRKVGWLEGPAYDRAGSVWFVDLGEPFDAATPDPTRILRLDIASGNTEVVLGFEQDPRVTGLAFDPMGRLVAAEGPRGRLTRRDTADPTQFEVLVESSEQRPAIPNDLVIDGNGNIFFSHFAMFSPSLGDSAVYCVAADNKLHRASKLDGFKTANGIAISPDGRTLYVAVTLARKIFAYDVAKGGVLSNRRLFASSAGGPDGLTVDRFGNVYAADAGHEGPPPPRPGLPGSKVIVWNPEGKEILRFEPPHGAVNLVFAPPGDSLYITGWNVLVRVPIRFDEDAPVTTRP